MRKSFYMHIKPLANARKQAKGIACQPRLMAQASPPCRP